MNTRRYKNIGYFRVLACIGVVCTHLGQKIQITGKPYELTHYMQHGVYLFFIISGFLALYTYKSKGYTVWEYWAGRMARILPVYYAIIIYDIVLCQFVLKSMPPDEYHLGWIRYILLINQCVPGEAAWRNISSIWTVSVFVLFYLLVPLIDKFVKTYLQSWIALIVTYGSMIVIKMTYGYFGIDGDWFSPIFYVIYFMFGVVICKAVEFHKENNAIVIFGALMLYYFAMSKFNSLYTLSFLLSIIILASMELEFKNKYIQKCFDVIDVYSYEIYLGHAIVMEAIDLIRVNVEISVPMILLIGVVGTVLVSMFLYHVVDKPINKWIKGAKKC